MAVIVVMGVAGSGKTTVGTRLAEALGVEYAEADAFLTNIDIDDRSMYLRVSGDRQGIVDDVARIDGVEDVVAPTAEQVLTTSRVPTGYPLRWPTSFRARPRSC